VLSKNETEATTVGEDDILLVKKWENPIALTVFDASDNVGSQESVILGKG